MHQVSTRCSSKVHHRSLPTENRLLIMLDRLARMAGEKPMTIPVVHENPMETSALPTPDSYTFFSEWEKKSNWKNEVTVKRYLSLTPHRYTTTTDLRIQCRASPRQRPVSSYPPYRSNSIVDDGGGERRSYANRHCSRGLFESARAEAVAHHPRRSF